MSITILIILMFSVIIHEVSHGWVAEKFGDSTARNAGRLTLNPIPHIDLFGTVLLPLLLLLSNSGFFIGWAKPVPVNPHFLKNPKKDLIWVSASGPMSNLTLAIFFSLVIKFIRILPAHYMGLPTLYNIAHAFIQINIILAVFNLLPIPPLDGSKILMGFLPTEWEYKFRQFERNGLLILFSIIMIGHFLHIPILSIIISPFYNFFYTIFLG